MEKGVNSSETGTVIPDICSCTQVIPEEGSHVEGSELLAFEKLNITYLPEDIRTDENVAFILKNGQRVVKITGTKCSSSRGPNDKVKQYQGEWNGSGFVIKQMEEILIIATNKHVLFDEYEVQHSKVYFFYDDEEADNPGNGFGQVRGLHIINLKEEYDLILAVYLLNTHQKEWLKRAGFADELTPVQKTSGRPSTAYVCIIHHPRGLPKRVSFSEISDVEGAREELFYDAPTYGGSSGAPLLVISGNKAVSAKMHRYHVGRNEAHGKNVGKQCDITLLMQCWMSTVYNLYLKKCSRELSEQGLDFLPLEDLLTKLHEVGIIRFGEQRLSSGIDSPVDFDLRVIAWYPDLMRGVAMHIKEKAQSIMSVNAVCGVPYRGMLVAIVLGVLQAVSIVLQRKEGQESQAGVLTSFQLKPGEWCSNVGTTSPAEAAESTTEQESPPQENAATGGSGSPQPHTVPAQPWKQAGWTAKQCVVVDDVAASGCSILESVEKLRKDGFEVDHAVVFLDRGQGASQMLKNHKITLHSVFTMLGAAEILKEADRIKTENVVQIQNYIKENQIYPNLMQHHRTTMCYKKRADLDDVPPVTKKLLKVMAKKKSNLVVAVDKANSTDALALIREIGCHICAVKTRTDIFEDYNPRFSADIQELAKEHDFLIIEDRKFSDIGHIVAKQYKGGLYKPVEWADFVTAHALPGKAIIQTLKEVAEEEEGRERGCLLEAEMSSDFTLAEGPYSRKTLTMVAGQDAFAVGLICRSNLTSNPRTLLFAAGVKMEEGKDDSGQNYLTPHEAIVSRGADIIIVGRGITEDANPPEKAKVFKEAGYKAYLERLNEDERKIETEEGQQN